MRTLRNRLAAFGAAFVAVLGMTASSAFGDRWVRVVDTAPVSYYVPTSQVVSTSGTYFVPTSYVYPTTSSYSYVLPASYSTTAYTYLPTSYSTVVPTSYSTVVPTSYSTVVPTAYSTVTPTYYTETYYRRPGLLRRLGLRPVIETTRTYSYDLYPTTYYSPTTITYEPTVATTSYLACAESAVPFNPPAPTNGAAAETSKSIVSKPKDGGEQSYNPTDETPKSKAAPKATSKDASKDAQKEQIPVDAPAPEKDPSGLNPPVDTPKPGDSQERTSFRPQFTEFKAKTGTTSQSILRGEVVSASDGQPKEGVQIVFVHLTGKYRDKERKTTAKGTFEIFLPDGDWSVRVIDPKAAANTTPPEFLVVTAAGGRYLDDNGSPLYGLRLSQ